MKHDFRTCRDDDCDDCQFLVDSGRICSCDYCSEMLGKETHGYRVIDGLIYHNICIKYVMTPEKECYNQLLAIFLDYPDEKREYFLDILERYESRYILCVWNSAKEDLYNLVDRLNCPVEDKIEALKLLIKTFNIKAKIQYSSGACSGQWYSSPILGFRYYKK